MKKKKIKEEVMKKESAIEVKEPVKLSTVGSEKSLFSPKGYIKKAIGSILAPQSGGLSMILCPTSMSGKPTHKVVDLFDTRWKAVKREYKGWYSERVSFKYGSVKSVAVQSDAWVMLCLCQDESGLLNESALKSCLKELVKQAKYEKASIHIDKLVLEEVPLLKDMLSIITDEGVLVYLYE